MSVNRIVQEDEAARFNMYWTDSRRIVLSIPSRALCRGHCAFRELFVEDGSIKEPQGRLCNTVQARIRVTEGLPSSIRIYAFSR